ncbi:MAG: hypothetical protein R3F59_24565 [Myxococcota bacterium]
MDGTYRVVVNLGLPVTDGVSSWRVPGSDTLDVLFGSATTLVPRDVVSEDACLQCHQQLMFHGDQRTGLDGCLACHVQGAEDRYSTTDPSTTPGVTIAFRVMLHKIHAGNTLTQPYVVDGYGVPYVAHTYEHVAFPRNDGGVTACTACHADSDAWLDPSTAVCTSCHDSPDAAAHAAINTDPVFGESCDVCHGAGAAFAPDLVHSWGVAR